jgi:hypothetical protein
MAGDKAMRVVLLLLLLIVAISAFELKMVPKARAPCKEKLCYEHYLDKMRGFMNGTAA